MRHFDSTSSEKTTHQCKVCQRTFNRRSTLRTHMRVHSTDRPFKCPQCEKTFKDKQTLKGHVNVIHLKKAMYKEQCKVCGLKIKDKMKLEVHMKRHNGIKDHKCPKCSKVFVRSYDVDSHLRMVHSKEKPFKCQMCPMEFKAKISLQGQIVRDWQL